MNVVTIPPPDSEHANHAHATCTIGAGEDSKSSTLFCGSSKKMRRQFRILRQLVSRYWDRFVVRIWRAIFSTVRDNADIFLTKYNQHGDHVWSRQIGSTADDVSFAVTTDSQGNTYVTGFTQGILYGESNAGG